MKAEVLFQALRELGYVRDQNLEVVWPSWDGGNEQLAEVVPSLIARQVDIVVSSSGTATQAVIGADSTIPIVMGNFAGDPVALGFAASLSHPGGKVTGLLSFSGQLPPKRLQLLRDVMPTLARVGVLSDPDNPTNPPELRSLQEAARLLGVEILAHDVREPDDLERALGMLEQERVEAVVPLASPLVTGQVARIVAFTAQHRLLSIYDQRIAVEAGGLLAYGPNVDDLWRRAATFVAKILEGANPGDLPIERAEKFEFVVNLKTARTLGLTIPPGVLTEATEVIQ